MNSPIGLSTSLFSSHFIGSMVSPEHFGIAEETLSQALVLATPTWEGLSADIHCSVEKDEALKGFPEQP